MAVLRELAGHNPGHIRELRDGVTVIGRNPKRCQIVLDHYAVSREHARLECANCELYIEDLHSRNGIMVNGEAVPPGPGGRYRLRNNDLLEIAGFRFVVEDKPNPGDNGVYLVNDETEIAFDILSTVDVSSDSHEVRSHENAAERLRAVLRIIEDLAQAISLDEVLPKVLDSLFTIFPQAERGFVLLKNARGELLPVASKRMDNRQEPIRSSRTIVDEAVSRRSAILSGDASRDARFAASESIHRLNLRSVMCAPLLDHLGQVLGAIQLEVTDPVRQFRKPELQVLAGVARHIATVVENSRLYDAALLQQRDQLERRFQRLVEGSLEGIMVQRDLIPLFANEAWAELHGHRVQDILDLDSIEPLIAEQDRARVVRELQSVLEGEATERRYEYQALRSNGSPVWLENLVTVVEWEGAPAILTTALDITDRKRVEEQQRRIHAELEVRVAQRTAELGRERDLLRTLMDHLPDYIFIKDHEGRFITTNAAHLQALHARSVDEVRGKTDFEFFPKELAEQYREKESQVLSTGQPLINFQEQLVDEQGNSTWLLTTKAPWRDEKGTIIGIVGMCRNISELKKADEAKAHYLAQLERSFQDLEHFAAIAAHDLQEPLRAIGGFCELLRQRLEGKLDAESRSWMQEIVGGAHRMQGLIDGLRTYAKATGGALSAGKVDMQEVLSQALANLDVAIHESGAEIVVDPLPVVQGNSLQLMQVLQNLIANAIKFRRDGRVRIEIRAEKKPGEWQFCVRDNGVGIDPKFFSRIFVIFQRVCRDNQPGTGIGLAICKKVIEQHHGRIWVESAPGEGSAFYFTLPG